LLQRLGRCLLPLGNLVLHLCDLIRQRQQVFREHNPTNISQPRWLLL